MKQSLPSTSSGSKPYVKPLLTKKNLGRVQASTGTKVLRGAVYGLLLCGLGWYLGNKTTLFSSKNTHQIVGNLYLDANGNQSLDSEEKNLPFVRLQLHADLNRNQRLDAEDLPLASTVTDAEGNYQFNIAHQRSVISRVDNPRHEIQTNTVSGSTRIGESILSLGGDGGVSNLTTLRFTQLQIPREAIIHRAYLRFRAAKDNRERPVFWVFGEKISPSNPAYDEENPYTDQHILWECGVWKADHYYQSPDLSPVITALLQMATKQEIALVIEGREGLKEAYSSAEHAPQLFVEYELPAYPYLVSVDPVFSGQDQASATYGLAFKNHESLALAYPGTPPLCLAVSQDKQMISLNWQSGQFFDFPLAERPPIELSYLSWGGSELYGIFQGNLGRVSVPEGSFQKLRLKHKSSIKAIAHDAASDLLWLVDEAGYLIQYDPRTEQVLSQPVSLVGFAELSTGKIEQMAYLPDSQHLYILIQKPQGLRLFSLALPEGKIIPLGPLMLQGRELTQLLSLSNLPDGRLLLLTGKDNVPELQNQMFAFQPNRQKSEIIQAFPRKLSLEKCACISAPPHSLEGQVFFDRNGNGLQDQEEMVYPNIRLELYEDSNQNDRLDDQDCFQQTLYTDQNGRYHHQAYRSAQYLIKIDRTSLPAGIALIGSDLLRADLRNYLAGAKLKSLDFTANRESQIAEISWSSLRVHLVEGHAKLRWSTLLEKEPGYFYILRSEDGIRYDKIGRIVADGPSGVRKQYQFIDEDLSTLLSGHAVYRIRWENVQGQSSYSDIVSLGQTDADKDFRVELSPGNNRPLDLRYRSKDGGKVDMRVINLAGQTIFRKHLISGPDWRQLEIGSQDWQAGIYYLQWDAAGDSQMKKLVIR